MGLELYTGKHPWYLYLVEILRTDRLYKDLASQSSICTCCLGSMDILDVCRCTGAARFLKIQRVLRGGWPEHFVSALLLGALAKRGVNICRYLSLLRIQQPLLMRLDAHATVIGGVR